MKNNINNSSNDDRNVITIDTTVGFVLNMMWNQTITQYPHLQEIKDWNYIHAILACRTEAEQNLILERYRNQKNSHVN